MAAKKNVENSKSVTIKTSTDGAIPRLVILGRGQLHGRKLHAIRVKPELLDRLRSLASGPDYLLVEMAIAAFCDDLERRPATDMRVIRAEELG
jgi:hypothetical protein